MAITGHVQNGVVVFDGLVSLPEGAAVTVIPVHSTKPQSSEKARIECETGRLPLVRGGTPGTVNLTNERIHEILDEEDVEAVKRQWNVSS